MKEDMRLNSRCGYVAIIGRPNVGKSTLINHILGQKISITSRKPQTTRHRLLGIKTNDNVQAIYVDTPGLHQKEKRALNRYMNRMAMQSMRDVDVIVFMVDSVKWTSDDQWILNRLKSVSCPVILAINKVDKIENKEQLLPLIQQHATMTFAHIVPISALKGIGIDTLEKLIDASLPENPHFFPDDQITDVSERFMAAEIVREKLIRSLGQELPYTVAVEIEKFKQEKKILHIAAIIWVEKTGQKTIVIGKQGAVLKKIGTSAREDMEVLFHNKVFLQLWVKVKENWSDNERILKSLGYSDFSE